ncbi:MAG: hypothetical protein GW878_04265, partial [Acidobacteria bacterium]|nr:hypothetical protein [Acidobacteriota bacterium]
MIHVALLLLCRHRNVHQLGDIWLLLPSVAFAGVPWMLSTPPWLATGLVTHLAWFVACERLLLQPAPAATANPVQPRPAGARPPSAVRPLPATRPAPGVSRAAEPATARTASTDFHPAPVLAVFVETDDIKTFRLSRPEGFAFKPGQFLMVRVQVDGRPLVRCYSISSPPEITGYLEISVKRLGIVSSTLHATLRPGSMLAIKGPAGEFIYPAGDDRPVVFIAGGVGITPLASMFRHGLLADPTRPMTFLYSVRDERQIAYRREFAWLAERFPHARVAFVVSDGPHEIGHFSGHITDDLIRETAGDVVNSIFMLCGPPPMMDAMKQALLALGVGEKKVRYE